MSFINYFVQPRTQQPIWGLATLCVLKTGLRLTLALAVACLVLTAGNTIPAHAAPEAQAVTQRAGSVSGTLQPAGYHYLGLEPSLRDGTVVLTIAVEPADDVALRKAINFLVLTDDGLRRVLAGADPFDLDIAASAPLQFDPIGNKSQAVFRPSGRGEYTVVVYNTGGKIGGYTLTALNGVLIDDANQISVVAAAPAALNPPTLEAATTPTETLEARVNLSKGSPLGAVTGTVTQPAPSVNALRLSGALDPALSRHFLNVQPNVRDGQIGIGMVYEPRGRQTDGLVNFYVMDEDALRRFVYGSDFDAVELAAGVQRPFSPDENDLVAAFTASGSSEYTVVPFSESPLTVTYVMQISGGQLIDRYGQTNEAAAARAEFAALSEAAAETAAVTTTTAAEPVSAVPNLQLTLPGEQALTLVGTAPSDPSLAGAAIAEPEAADSEPQSSVRVTQIAGALPTPYAHNYWSLIPTIRDGVVVVTLDYDPRDQEALQGGLNFWVVDEDGMRRVVSGAQPESVALAGGSEVRYGVDKGKLQASFQASGKGQYAVIVYNDTAVPATYTVTALGGQLLAPAAGNDLVQILP